MRGVRRGSAQHSNDEYALACETFAIVRHCSALVIHLLRWRRWVKVPSAFAEGAPPAIAEVKA